MQDCAGSLRADVQSYVFDNGRAVFLGLVPDRTISEPPGQDIVVSLAHKFHIYDVRRKQYLGHSDVVRTGILPTEARLFAFLPEQRIEGMKISLSKEVLTPSEIAN